FLKISTTEMNKRKLNIRECDIPLPDSKPKNINVLSIKSGKMEPKIRANLLKENFFFMYGNSKIVNGTAMCVNKNIILSL
ncbi:MAG: hypothetical protein P8Y97_23715, partial [Candidatus Lokiarchaeota archaeon]